MIITKIIAIEDEQETSSSIWTIEVYFDIPENEKIRRPND